MTTISSIALYCTEGSSDKEYHLMLEEQGSGYVVNYANGRRGGTLRTGTKTATPVDREKAQSIYDRLVKSKIKGGYTEATSGARYVGTDLEARDSGLTPMLPSPIDHTELLLLQTSSDWAFQEKHDGENRPVILEDGTVTAVNRRGLTCPVREEWTAPASTARTVIYGEDMGERLIAFDIGMVDGRDVSGLDLVARIAALTEAVADIDWIDVSPIATGLTDKSGMLARIEFEQGEGVVAKRIAAPLEGGRTDEHRKFKFQESATFEVIRVNDQRSIGLGLYDGDQLIDLGNVTIPANRDIPAVGDLVEVEYMLRYENGALMQPKYKGPRTDIDEKPGIDQITRIKAKKAA